MLSRQQAIELWNSADLIALGLKADTVRKQLHPSNIVTYTNSTEDKAVERVFRASENIEQRLQILENLRARQADAQDIVIFRPLVEPGATGVEYVKTLALSRLCLGNVPHIQASYGLFGLKVAQLSLRFGADDLGVATERASEEELRRVIRDAGFVPKQRDALFRSYSLA